MNSLNIIGRLTRDPELVQVKGDLSLCKFSIACSSKFDKEKTSFFDCVAWRKTADTIAQYFSKGKQIAIEGRIEQDRFQDKDGNNRSKVTIQVDNFTFLVNPYKKDNTSNQDKPKEKTPTPGDITFEKTDPLSVENFNDDEVPF